MKKRHILLTCICTCLVLTSCANGKKKKGSVLKNTLSNELSESIIQICSVDNMDEMSTLMIPVNGFKRKPGERVKEEHKDTTLSPKSYPIDIFLKSFYDFKTTCNNTSEASIKEFRTYVDYNGYGMGVYGISYKLEAIVNNKLYSAFSKTENLGMFSSSKKSIDYQSAALTSAFYELYRNIYDDLN